jgi:tetratricopeptide (TPR) repeat protein
MTKDAGQALIRQDREKPAVKTPPVKAPEVKARTVRPSDAEKKAAVKPIAVDADLKAGPVTTEIELLESTVKTDPRNSLAAYRLCGIYFDQGRYGDARRVLRGLMLKLPQETVAPFMLARAEYSLRNYAEALSLVRRMSDPSNRSKLDREDELRIAVYSALCLRGMGQKRSSASFYDQAAGSVAPEELDRMLREEGLVRAWQALKTALGKRPVPGK